MILVVVYAARRKFDCVYILILLNMSPPEKASGRCERQRHFLTARKKCAPYTSAVRVSTIIAEILRHKAAQNDTYKGDILTCLKK
jgi:hypothetical protein